MKFNSCYPTPASLLGSIVQAHETSTGVTLLTEGRIPLEVSHYSDIGWSIEVRYDKACPNTRRQQFTGLQETLSRSPLSYQEHDTGSFFLTEEKDSKLTFSKDGLLSLEQEGVVMQCLAPAFTAHAEPVSLYESIMSLKVTDFSIRENALKELGWFAGKYLTRMVRFQYLLPEGVVLGLPGQTGEPNRRGYRFELHNTDTFSHTPNRPPMYQSWPILFHPIRNGEKWLGVFHDNPSQTFVDIGDFYPDIVTFESSFGNSRVYLFIGDSLDEVSSKLSLLLGAPPALPDWAFGYQQCRWSYMSTSEARDVARSMRKERMPCDALYFDIDYMDGFRVFTTDPENFSDLDTCIHDLNQEGFRTICIVDPAVKTERGYRISDELLSMNGAVKTRSGEPYPVACWAEHSHLPDFSDAKVQEWWAVLHKDWLSKFPFSGIWNDMNEPANFLHSAKRIPDASIARGELADEYNLYGYWMSQATAKGWSDYSDEPGLVITRSGYPGVQRYAVIWHGDNQAWWEHLRLALQTAVSFSLCGVPYTGADIPGFTGNPPGDLAVRFFQLGAFLPFFRGHSMFFANDKEPYAFPEPFRSLIRAAIELRYSLVKEWIHGYEQARSRQGPLLKPVLTKDNHLIADEFELFSKILVAPIMERDQRKRLVYLPPGTWYRLGNITEKLQGDEWIVEEVSLATVPVYVRGGCNLQRTIVGATVEETLKGGSRVERYR
jgi:alpha-glucosidase